MAEAAAPKQLKIFISYSRRDRAFADRLVEALKSRGFEVRIDRQDLPKLEDWERELLGFIREADTVIFIASPHSLASKVVTWEIEQVRLNNKRLAPVVIANIQGDRIPADIARINFFFFIDEASFEQNADELAHALNTDVAWLKEHTRIGELGRRWIERGNPEETLLRGQDLDEAESWAACHPREAPPVTVAQLEFLRASRTAQADRLRREEGQVRGRRRMQVLSSVLLAGSLIYLSWANWSYLKISLVRLVEAAWPKVLTAAAEGALRPGDSFKECLNCPEMVVVPAGEFTMGSRANETNHTDDEGPPHKVTIASAFAVSRFEVTFDEWDACVMVGGCVYQPPDQGWGRGARPVINVSWDDAKGYVAWLSRQTTKSYRLLSEAEWEYAARAGSEAAYSWSDEIGKGNANCRGCGSSWDNKQTAPVGSFAANAFGLHDMHGNVWEWVEDCWADTYQDAPTDGAPRTTHCTDDTRHVVRGGAWNDLPTDLRAAVRYGGPTGIRNDVNGIRLARTLGP
jgi:formylglycine-generating enzyme required for sulfatase activity